MIAPGDVRGSDWTRAELGLIVGDYFDMLRAELLDVPYNKTSHRKALQELLPARTKGSVEFKHQNISAVLVGFGLPYVEGYKPLGNYQSLLEEVVGDFLYDRPQFIEQFEGAPRLNPVDEKYPDVGLDLLFVPRPERLDGPTGASMPWPKRRTRLVNFAKRDADNRRMGMLGEKFSLALEKRRLFQAGRDDLANKVEWVSQTIGDGLGFDLLSFDELTDSEKYIEVKTTGMGRFSPFYVTDNEVRFSEAEPARYQLYRVFDFSTSPRLYVLSGALSLACRLSPVQYRATI